MAVRRSWRKKLNRFSFAAAAVILGCLSALKGPDVLRYWYVMERALSYLFVRVATSVLPPCLSPFLLKIEIILLVPECTFIELAVEFINLGNIYWVILAHARRRFRSSQSRIRQKSAFKKFVTWMGRWSRGRRAIISEYTGVWGSPEEGTPNADEDQGGVLSSGLVRGRL